MGTPPPCPDASNNRGPSRLTASPWLADGRRLSAGVVLCLLGFAACAPTVKVKTEKPIEVSVALDLTVHVPELRDNYKRPAVPAGMTAQQRDVKIVRALQGVYLQTDSTHALVFRKGRAGSPSPTSVTHEVTAPRIPAVQPRLQKIPPARQHNDAVDILSRGQCVVSRLDKIADKQGRHSAVVDLMREEGMAVGAACPFFDGAGRHMGEVLLTWPALALGRERMVIRELAHATRDIETFLR